MSNTKITALTELATIDDTSDVVAIADVSASTTKKLTWSTIRTTIATYLASLTQTLTNKTIDLGGNTVTGTTAQFNTALSDGNFATQAGSEALTNKTIDADSNTITNIENADIKAAAAVALNKLAATTASRALVSDGSGFVSAATTTATEIGYVNGVTSAIQTQINTKAPTSSPTFTGTPAAPLASAGTSTTQLATTSFVQQEKVGYTLVVGAQSISAADSTTYYFGPMLGSSIATTAGTRRTYVPKSGTVKRVDLFYHVGGVLGTTENSTVSFRLNDTTDTSLTATLVLNAENVAVAATGLSVAVTEGDFFEIKWVTPAWVTNPTTVRPSAVVYIE